MSSLTCFLNDRFIPLAEAGLPVTDLGVQRGYGIFDFLRITQNVPLFCDDHLDRFFYSAKEMRLPVQQTKEGLKEIIRQLIIKNNLPDSGIRIMLSGGNSPDGYQIMQPNLVVVQQFISPPSEKIDEQGIRLVTYAHQRQMPYVKTTDYLMAIWLQPWIKEKEADDVLYHQNEIVSECPRSNFFIVTQSNTLVTPGRNILKGITRKQILEVAAMHGIAIEERAISIEDIRAAKEAFISSSTKRLIRVSRVDDIDLGTGATDSVTAQLFHLFREHEKEVLRVALL